MDKKVFMLVCVSLIVACHHLPGSEKVKTAFIENQIVPDVLVEPPGHLLDIKYFSSGKTVDLGNEIAPVDVKDQPEVVYEADQNEYYTLIMTDPDAPSRANPIRREFRHWSVVNIPGTNIAKGEILTAYVGSGPPKDSGLHRYIFLLYKQPGKLTFDEKRVSNTEIGDRPLFSAQKFAEKYGLHFEAGNFYQAQYDDWVPNIQKQLGLGKKTAKP